jgi:hypothetical protein
MFNPAITNNAFCILAMRSATGPFNEGFEVIGPFANANLAIDWAEIHIVKTPFDNPHWVVVNMTQVGGKWGIPT